MATKLKVMVLVTIDCLRHDYTSYVLKAIPRDWGKIVFQKHYANAPYTWASFPSIFTSTPPSIMGNYSLRKRLTFIEVLSDRGYLTIGVNGGNPYLISKEYSRLFDIYIDLHTVVNDRLDRERAMRVRKIVINGARQFTRRFSEKLNLTLDNFLICMYYSMKNIASKARYPLFDSFLTTVSAIKSLMKALSRRSNIFLWIHYMDLHFPYSSHTRVEKGLLRTSKLIWDYIEYESMGIFPRDITSFRRMYEESLRYIVSSLGILLGYLHEALSGSDIYVIITSDHGEEFGEHSGLGHEGIRRGSLRFPHLYEELIHVPLVITSPNISGEIPVSSNVITSHIDLAPTILELAEVKLPIRVRSLFLGRSLIYKMNGDTNEILRAYAESAAVLTKHLSNSCNERIKETNLTFSIVEERYKYIYHPILGEELYDLYRDPNERNSLSSNLPDIIKHFRQELKKYLMLRRRFKLKYQVNLAFIHKNSV